MNKLDFTILNYEQIKGKNKLNVFKKVGYKASITDFSILLGGSVSNYSYIDNDNSLENRTGNYWTKKIRGNNFTMLAIIDKDGTDKYSFSNNRTIGCRPAINIFLDSNIFVSTLETENNNGIIEIEYGIYPQMAPSKIMQEKLEDAFFNELIKPTGNCYTTDSKRYKSVKSNFLEQVHIEYEFEGNRYIRVRANSCFDGNEFVLSNGESYKDGDYVWIKVEPIKWLYDIKNNIMLAKKILFAGIRFCPSTSYFLKSNIKKFINNYFSKEIFNNLKPFDFNHPLLKNTLYELEQKNNGKLKKYGLHENNINVFRNKIKSVSKEDKNILGKKLYELISDESYCEKDHLKDAINLILEGADLEYKDSKNGDYLLLICLQKNFLETFILLLRAGANINQVNNDLVTVTMACCKNGNEEILHLLILLNVDINKTDIYGNTAIMLAKANNKIECFNILLNASASLTNKNQKGQTLSDLDGNDSKFNIENLLIDKNDEKANINSDDIIGEALSKMNEILGDDKELIIDQIHNDEKLNCSKTKKKIFKYSADNIKWDDIDE